MIRLGSLAGYFFDGPKLLGGMSFDGPGVFVVLYRPDAESKPERYAVTYVGHSAELAGEGLPFRHPRAGCWVKRAGSKWKVYVATLEVAGRGHREAIANELIAKYRPRCNRERYENFWKAEWISS